MQEHFSSCLEGLCCLLRLHVVYKIKIYDYLNDSDDGPFENWSPVVLMEQECGAMPRVARKSGG